MSLQLFGGNSAYSFNAPIIDQKKKGKNFSIFSIWAVLQDWLSNADNKYEKSDDKNKKKELLPSIFAAK